MTLLALLRHAHAGDPERWDGPDDARPLSARGRRQAERLGRLLRTTDDHPDFIVSSPKVRALQTAEIVGELLGVPVATDPRLGAALDLEVIESILVDTGDAERPMLVGHDPDFSDALGALVGTGAIGLRKGAYAQVDVDRPLAHGGGELRALVPPDLLRGSAGGSP